MAPDYIHDLALIQVSQWQREAVMSKINLADTKPTMQGYTREVFMTCMGGNGHFLVREDTDLSDTFEAWCLETKSFIIVDGYLWEEM